GFVLPDDDVETRVGVEGLRGENGNSTVGVRRPESVPVDGVLLDGDVVGAVGGDATPTEVVDFVAADDHVVGVGAVSTFHDDAVAAGERVHQIVLLRLGVGLGDVLGVAFQGQPLDDDIRAGDPDGVPAGQLEMGLLTGSVAEGDPRVGSTGVADAEDVPGG